MIRSIIPLGRTFGSEALSNVRMNLLASHSRMLLSFAIMIMMTLAPQGAKSQSYEPKLDETYSFTDANWQGAIRIINSDLSGGFDCVRSIAGHTGDYSSWYEWQYRFAPEGITEDNNTSAWIAEDGLKNKSGVDKDFRIRYLHTGDILYIEPAADAQSTAAITFKTTNVVIAVWNSTENKYLPQTETQTITNVDEDGNEYTETIEVVVPIEANHHVTRWERYICISDGDAVLNVSGYDNCRIQKVDITTYREAKYKVESVSDGGYKYSFTDFGVLIDKHPAIPFLTMQFGNDNNLTYVQKATGANGGINSTTIRVDNNGEWAPWATYTQENNQTVPYEGSYYYFYPEVDGRLIVHGFITQESNDRGDITFIGMKPDNSNWWFATGTANKKDEQHTFEANVEKGNKYYISGNPQQYPNCKPVFHLIDFTFIPDASVYTGPLSYVTEPGATSVSFTQAQKNGEGNYINLKNNGLMSVAKKRCLGNIDDKTTVSYDTSSGALSANIVFKTTTEGKTANPGGAILVYMNPVLTNNSIDPDVNSKTPVLVITVPYKAESYDNQVTKQVKVWDFYTNSLELGKSTVTSSQLYKEMHYSDGSVDWVKDNLNHYKEAETVFKSVYEMEWDNADMIVETEGLLLQSGTNETCIYNENDPNPASFQERFVGLLPGAKLNIPKLKKHDRVRMLIGRYGGPNASEANAYLTVTNGRDVSLEADGSEGWGKLITDNYVIGGTTSRISGGNCVLYGEYNFIVDHDGDFSISMNNGRLIKLYRIEIYNSGQEFVSTNNVLRNDWCTNPINDYELVYTEDDTEVKGMSYNLHNHGKGERIEVLRIDRVTGNLGNTVNFEENSPGDATSVAYSPVIGKFGAYRLMLGCKTQQTGSNTKYITDRAQRTMAVGYRKTMNYPYTWDFTDLKREYVNKDHAASHMNVEIGYGNGITSGDPKIWPSDAYKQRVSPIDNLGILFANGSQLYAGDRMFPETEGLGIGRTTTTPADLVKFNETLQMADDGLILNCTGADMYHKIVIPKVTNNAAVYVRATPISGATTKAQYTTDGTSANDLTVLSAGNDKIYVVKNTTGSTKDIGLWLNGMKVQRIAVAKDEKSVNVKGYASESRDHAIDASLLPFFTGKDMKTYLVSNPDYNKHTITLTDCSKTKDNEGNTAYPTTNYVIPANTGYIIFNNTDKNVLDLFGSNTGFHLFVPDMHDDEKSEGKFADVEINNQFMVPVLEERTKENKLMSFSSDGKKTNYVLSYKWYDLNPDGSTTGIQHTGDEMFYRVSKEGINLRANSAYLVLPTESLGLTTSQGSVQGLTQSAMFTFVFSDWNDIPSVPTAIEGANVVETFDATNSVWYNLNGQKINGMPTTKGLYIVNGKKVLVK